MNTTLILKRAAARRATASRTDASWQLTDEQWFLIADLLEPPPPSTAGGRPWTNSRACLEGILWVLRTGARWKDLPKSFPSPSSCWRRLKLWTENGLFTKAWERALRKLDSLQGVDWEQAMADATFSPAKKGGTESDRPRREREPSSWSLLMETESHWQSTWPTDRPRKSS